MRISDWSSDVCSSDLTCLTRAAATVFAPRRHPAGMLLRGELWPAKAEISTVPPDGRMPNLTGSVIYSYDHPKECIQALKSAGSSLSNCKTSPLRGWLTRSDARRVGTEGVSTCSSRWAAYLLS